MHFPEGDSPICTAAHEPSCRAPTLAACILNMNGRKHRAHRRSETRSHAAQDAKTAMTLYRGVRNAQHWLFMQCDAPCWLPTPCWSLAVHRYFAILVPRQQRQNTSADHRFIYTSRLRRENSAKVHAHTLARLNCSAGCLCLGSGLGFDGDFYTRSPTVQNKQG